MYDVTIGTVMAITSGAPITNADVPRKMTKSIGNTRAYLEKQLSPENQSIREEVKNFVRQALGKHYNPSATFGVHGQPVPNIEYKVNLDTGFFTVPGHAQVAGIYLFSFLLDPSRFYIGSSVGVSGRVHGHKKEQKERVNQSLYSLVAKFGWAMFSFGLIHPSTNFLSLFKASYPGYELSVAELRCLTTASVLELNILEQAYLDQFNPPLTDEVVVSSSFVRDLNSTKPRKHRGGHDTKTVSMYLPDENGDYTVLVSTFDSISLAAAFLTPGRDRNYVKRYADSMQPLVSEALGGQAVMLCITNRESSPSNLGYSSVATYPYLEHNFEVIPGQIGVIPADMSTITYYTGWKVAATAVGLKENQYMRISRWTNQAKAITTPKGVFYFISKQRSHKIEKGNN